MIKKIKLILIHIVIGIGLFYFLVHPFTMVLYWFESTQTAYSFSLFQEVLKERLFESFTFSMMPMSNSLTALGGMFGLISGIFWTSFKEKKQLIKKQEHLLMIDVLKLIKMGENDWVEFKSSIRYDYHQKFVNRELEIVIAKTIVGFMNAKGGKLIIGLNDEGVILGLQKDFQTLKHKNKDGFEREIFRIILNYLGTEASFNIHVSFYQIGKEDICLVDVEPSLNPVYVSDGKNTTFYVRTGNATYPLSVKETVKYLKLRNSN
jgi:hypothetical protein